MMSSADGTSDHVPEADVGARKVEVKGQSPDDAEKVVSKPLGG